MWLAVEEGSSVVLLWYDDVGGCGSGTCVWSCGLLCFLSRVFFLFCCFFFFFQAEDGIRDIGVTGVQTCALPISDKFAF